MVLERQAILLEEFDAFVTLPENIDKNFEFIDGEIIQKPMVAHPQTGIVANNIVYALIGFIRPRDLGYLTGAENGYTLGGNRVIPDIAFISKDRYSTNLAAGYQVVAPDLAIEVISPSDRTADIMKKVAHYVAADVVLWLVDPQKKTITVYEPDGGITTYRNGETLEGTGLFEGFTMNLGEVFVV